MSLGAGIAWAATNILIKGSRLTWIGPEKLLLYQLAASTVVAAAVLPFAGPPIRDAALVPTLAMLFQAFYIVAVTYVLWFWLMQRYPAIELQVEAEDSARSLRDGEFDLAIDLNDGAYPGFQSTVLLEEEIFPVCSPALLQSRPPLDSPERLDHYPLLHDMTAWRGSQPYAEWEGYLKAIGAPHVNVRRGYMFNRNHITIQGAIAGMGVAIARRTLTTNELASGLLVAPFAQSVRTGKRYCLVYSAGALDDRRVATVHDWIVAEARSAGTAA